MKNKNKQTKFPVARIKRIMQKDEEVGKVAQATPIVISKALELFLTMIIDEASKVTLERGSKKVEAYHLKHAVETTEMLDFLKEIVQAVPDPSAGGTIDFESELAEAKKKRARGKKNGDVGEPTKRKRKKKVASEESADGNGEEGNAEQEGRSEPEDVRMEDDDDEDDGGGVASGSRGGGYHKARYRPARDEPDEDWRDDEDKPYIPR